LKYLINATLLTKNEIPIVTDDEAPPASERPIIEIESFIVIEGISANRFIFIFFFVDIEIEIKIKSVFFDIVFSTPVPRRGGKDPP